MTDQRTSKDFFEHSETGEIYAIESLWSGGVVGSAGPLTEPLKDPDEYEYTAERNDWLQEQSEKMILI